MYLHLGQETTLRAEELIGIFDLDTSTTFQSTRDMLAKAEREGRVVSTSAELPRSFAVAGGKTPRIFLCQLSVQTLKKRLANPELNSARED